MAQILPLLLQHGLSYLVERREKHGIRCRGFPFISLISTRSDEHIKLFPAFPCSGCTCPAPEGTGTAGAHGHTQTQLLPHRHSATARDPLETSPRDRELLPAHAPQSRSVPVTACSHTGRGKPWSTHRDPGCRGRVNAQVCPAESSRAAGMTPHEITSSGDTGIMGWNHLLQQPRGY